MKGVLGPWPPERARLETLIHGLQERADSRLILSGTRRRERLDAALEKAEIELYRGAFAHQTATRFRESSFLLWKSGREEDARACLEAARSFSDQAPGGNPVARALLEVALAPLLKSLRESTDGDEEESLLVKA